MKILVTGGSGLVGNALKSVAPPTFPETNQIIYLSSKDCDLINTQSVIKLFETIKPDIVIHLAAIVGGLFKNLNNNLDMYTQNLIMNFNVIECCRLFNVKKSIFCLSTCVFPDSGVEYPISEQDLHKGPPHPSNMGYSYAKRMTQVHTELCNADFKKNGSENKMICVIPTNVYGPNDNFHLEDAHVVPALIHQCYLATKNNTDFVVRGSGRPLRQFIYSQDLAKLIWKIVEMDNPPESIILAPEKEIPISTAAELISEITSSILGTEKKNVNYDIFFSDGQYKKTASTTLLKFLFPDFQFTDIKKGLTETISWFIENYETARV